MTPHVGFPRISEVFFALCKSVDTPTSLGAWLRFKYDQRELANFSIDPRQYNDAYTFSGDYLVSSFLSKWKGLKTEYNLEEEALQRFKSAESECLKTNIRIRELRKTPTTASREMYLSIARRKISKLLGPFSWFKVRELYGWGPGATSDISRRRAFVDTKLCQTPLSVTRRALPIARYELANDLHWSSVILGVKPEDIQYPFCFLPSVFSVNEECIIDTVPKNAKTHRVIAKENTLNGFLQKGFGAYFRRRLKCVGVDLDDQSVNQRAARAAFTEHLATLDLKAASDTVAIELVFELLPVDWALALNDVRSHSGILPNGGTLLLQKFSSMGNGFTFELESLLFWALTSAVVDVESPGGKVCIYGDDIILPQECASHLIDLLQFCGFTTNVAKSYTEGLFYESCGEHFFGGHNVTPCYQKEEVASLFESIRLSNRLIRVATRFGSEYRLDRRVFAAWSCSMRISQANYFQLPNGVEGDSAWLVPCDYFNSTPQDPNMGLRCRVLLTRTQDFPADERALLAWSLRRGVVTEAPYGGNVQSAKDRDPVKGHRWVIPTWEFGLSW